MSPDSSTTTGPSPADGAAPVTPAQAAMEEERDFLIRSLHDLDAERAAGDIDQADYETLRDDYTVRAAVLLRRLEEPEPSGAAVGDEPFSGPDDRLAPEPEPRSRRGWRTGNRRRRPWALWQKLVAAAIVVMVAALVGLQIGSNATPRTAGETITGGNNTNPTSLSAKQEAQLLSRAEAEASSNPVGAIELYQEILTAYPDQPQALTEEGWLAAQAGSLTKGETLLEHAELADDAYDPAHGYLGIVLFGLEDYTGSANELTYYLAHGPDPALTAQAKAVLVRAEALEATPATTTPSTP